MFVSKNYWPIETAQCSLWKTWKFTNFSESVSSELTQTSGLLEFITTTDIKRDLQTEKHMLTGEGKYVNNFWQMIITHIFSVGHSIYTYVEYSKQKLPCTQHAQLWEVQSPGHPAE